MGFEFVPSCGVGRAAVEGERSVAGVELDCSTGKPRHLSPRLGRVQALKVCCGWGYLGEASPPLPFALLPGSKAFLPAESSLRKPNVSLPGGPRPCAGRGRSEASSSSPAAPLAYLVVPGSPRRALFASLVGPLALRDPPPSADQCSPDGPSPISTRRVGVSLVEEGVDPTIAQGGHTRIVVVVVIRQIGRAHV